MRNYTWRRNDHKQGDLRPWNHTFRHIVDMCSPMAGPSGVPIEDTVLYTPEPRHDKVFQIVLTCNQPHAKLQIRGCCISCNYSRPKKQIKNEDNEKRCCQ